MQKPLFRTPRAPAAAGQVRQRSGAIALLLALGLAASACGSGGTSAGEGAAAETATTTASSAAVADDGASTPDSEPAADSGATLANYPSVDVIDLSTNETVNFADQVAGGSLPTLIWFWAPH